MLADRPMRVAWTAILSIVCCAFALGCRTNGAATVRDRFYSGDLDAAEEAAIAIQDSRSGDANIARLNQSMVQLFDGNAAAAEANLRAVRDQFDHLQQPNAVETASSMMTDDTKLAYAGEDYERILLRVFLSLSSIFSGSGDATAYATQVIDEQERVLARNQKDSVAGFKRVALAPYLRAALREERFTDSDDVRRSRAQVASWEPDFRQGSIDLARSEQGNHSRPGHGVVYVVALVGRGPKKIQTTDRPSSQSLLIADRVLSAVLDHPLPPTVAPVPVARVVRDGGGPDSVRVFANGSAMGDTETITNIGVFAEQQYAAIYPRVVARAIVRRMLKKSAVYAMKDRLDASPNSIADVALTLGGIAWEGTEKADVRCWSLLPDRIQVLRFELPAGSHRLSLQSVQGGQKGHGSEEVEVAVRDGRNTWMLAAFPVDRPVGQVLVR